MSGGRKGKGSRPGLVSCDWASICLLVLAAQTGFQQVGGKVGGGGRELGGTVSQ